MVGIRGWVGFCIGFWIGLCALGVTTAQAQIGPQLSGIGPVNRSMGGAAVAAPLDAIGALHWNPASISGLQHSELAVGVEVVTPVADMESRLGDVSGWDKSDSGWAAVPSIGLVHRHGNSPFTLGLGVFGVAGYTLNYPSSSTNPILFPPTPTEQTATPGLGRVFADLQILQIAPTVSVLLTDRLSIGVGPTVMLGKISLDPLGLAPPNPPGGDRVATFPDGTGTRNHWGGGFQVGVFYEGANCWNFGASYKSPQWFEDFTYHTTDASGLPRSAEFSFTYPSIASVGVSYRGWPRWTFAADVRYFDWESYSPLGAGPGFEPDGRLKGFGWDSTWSAAVGVQYVMNERVALRTGYTFNQNPVRDETAGFNVGSPLILQHHVNVGGTFSLSERLLLHAVYYHAFQNEVSGPIQTPAGPVPDSNVNYRVAVHGISMGITVPY